MRCSTNTMTDIYQELDLSYLCICFEILCDELTVKWDEFLGKPWYYSRTHKS